MSYLEFHNFSPVTIEIFNYREEWNRIVPFLDNRSLKNILYREVRAYIADYFGSNPIERARWAKYHAPYLASRGDYHGQRIHNLANASDEAKALYVKYPSDEAIQSPEFQKQFNAILKKLSPGKYDLEFYQLIHGCHWISRWEHALMQFVFPNEKICWIGAYTHSFAYYYSTARNAIIIFDINNFERQPYHFMEFVKEIVCYPDGTYCDYDEHDELETAS